MSGLEQYVPAWILSIVGILVAVTTVAALARKPPLKWIGRYLAWVFRQLVGTPIAGWLDHTFEDKARPIVREETQAVLAEHMENEENELGAINKQLADLGEVVVHHVEEDRAAFRNGRTATLAIAEHVGVDVKALVREEVSADDLRYGPAL